MSFRLSRVSPLLFCSGACALVYQVAWFRELRLIFGASTASSAAVLAVFMGGLGVGGVVLGKRADRAANPLRLYANLEILVAATVAVSPLLVALARSAYLGLGGASALGTTGATLLRLLLTVIVLGPSTVLMGGTLPAAAKAVGNRGSEGRQAVSALYGINTLGAVTGALAANFTLLEVFGTRLTLWSACLVNVLVGLAARSLARAPEESAAAPSPLVEPEAPAATAASATSHPTWFPPLAAGVAGVSFMLMELVWYRLLAPILGGSSYTFGLILAVALLGIAIGGVLYAFGRKPATLRGFAITCALEALFIAVPYALGDRLAMVALLLRPLSNTGFGATVGVWTFVAAIVVLPAAIVSGAQFPLVIGLYGRGDRSLGKDVGLAYFANTIGAIAGALAGGFGLVPLLGALGCWKLVVGLLVVTALLALFVGRAEGPKRERGLLVAALAILPLMLIDTEGPTAFWRHGGIGAGRADQFLGSLTGTGTERHLRSARSGFAWEQDGVESTVALAEQDGYVFIVNGKADGHARGDAATQVMGGMVGALVHKDPRRALVVGLGTGSTAGWLGAIPTMDRVDVVELEPAIVRVARDCAPVNHDVLANPKVKITLGDARETLLTSREAPYDIIFSEPSNPYRAGISSLYTREFYDAASKRLRADGLFLQWIQGYDVDSWAVATAVLTLNDVFKSVSVWATQRGDLLVMASASALTLDVDRMRQRLAEEPFASATRLAWGTESVEGVLAHFIANDQIGGLFRKDSFGAVNTDDTNILEFAFARGVGKKGDVQSDLLALASRLQIRRPSTTGAIDWQRVEEERALLEASQGYPPDPQTPSPQTHLFRELVGAYRGHDFVKANALRRQLDRKARNPFETVLFAEAASATNDPESPALIDAIRSPTDRGLLRAKWSFLHRDPVSAATALEHAFIGMRTDPWTTQALASEALQWVEDVGRADPVIARRLFDVLGEPFAVENQRALRLTTRVILARVAYDIPRCIVALGPLEPNYPWDHRLLETRVGCYVKASDPRALGAEEDMARFLDNSGSSMASLGPKTPPSAPAPLLLLPQVARAEPPAAEGGAAAEAGAGAEPPPPPVPPLRGGDASQTDASP